MHFANPQIELSQNMDVAKVRLNVQMFLCVCACVCTCKSLISYVPQVLMSLAETWTMAKALFEKEMKPMLLTGTQVPPPQVPTAGATLASVPS